MPESVSARSCDTSQLGGPYCDSRWHLLVGDVLPAPCTSSGTPPAGHSASDAGMRGRLISSAEISSAEISSAALLASAGR